METNEQLPSKDFTIIDRSYGDYELKYIPTCYGLVRIEPKFKKELGYSNVCKFTREIAELLIREDFATDSIDIIAIPDEFSRGEFNLFIRDWNGAEGKRSSYCYGYLVGIGKLERHQLLKNKPTVDIATH